MSKKTQIIGIISVAIIVVGVFYFSYREITKREKLSLIEMGLEEVSNGTILTIKEEGEYYFGHQTNNNSKENPLKLTYKRYEDLRYLISIETNNESKKIKEIDSVRIIVTNDDESRKTISGTGNIFMIGRPKKIDIYINGQLYDIKVN